MKRWKLIFIALFAIVSNGLSAQAAGSDGVSFSSWLKEPIEELNEQNTKALLLKIDQVIARNCKGAPAQSALFAIYPQFTITKSDIVETGMKSVHVIRAEVSLFAVNRIDMGVYGSVSLQLQGNGNSQQNCIRSIINQIRVTNPTLSKFIIRAKEGIVEHYKAGLPTTLTKVNSLIQMKQYEDALALLAVIPECVDNYTIVAQKMVEVYITMIDNNAKKSISKAKSFMAVKDYEAALGVLLEIDPNSNLFGEAEEIVSDITSKIDDKEKAEIEQQLKLYDDRKDEMEKAKNNTVKLKRMRIEASKNAGIEQAKTQVNLK
ncbi:MAG: hypothetical protein RSC28_08545 [Bacteroidales bacterium]